MAEKQQPWGKWFWGDWRKDARLRRCCYAARGLWADMLSLMGGEGDRFGFLIMEGQALGAGDLAGLLGGSEREVTKLLGELDGKRVFSRTGALDLEEDLHAMIPADMPTGVIFSRRMVRDRAKADADKANGKTGGNPRLKPSDNGVVNPPDKAQNPKPEPKIEKFLKDFVVGVGKGGGSEPMSDDNKIALFQKWLATSIGKNGWQIVGTAADPTAEGYSEAVEFCRKHAKKNGKGWPHLWPAPEAA